MRTSPLHWRTGRERRGQCGFTLTETLLVIGMLSMVSLGLLAMQPQVFKAQTTLRDEFAGFELMRACAERLLSVRRNVSYLAVTNTVCDGMGGVGGFASNPTVTLADANGNAITTCGTASCTATIIIAKTAAGPAAALTPITLQLTAY